MSPLPHDPGPHWGEVGIHGLHRPRTWDTIALVDAPGAAGDEVAFAALADGSLAVEAGSEADAAELARSIELAPPYRAEAVRRGDATWAVGMQAILVVRLPASLLGDELELVWDGSERSARVGGVPSLVSVPELEALATARYGTWVVRARRLRGDDWEVEIEPL